MPWVPEWHSGEFGGDSSDWSRRLSTQPATAANARLAAAWVVEHCIADASNPGHRAVLELRLFKRTLRVSVRSPQYAERGPAPVGGGEAPWVREGEPFPPEWPPARVDAFARAADAHRCLYGEDLAAARRLAQMWVDVPCARQ